MPCITAMSCQLTARVQAADAGQAAPSYRGKGSGTVVRARHSGRLGTCVVGPGEYATARAVALDGGCDAARLRGSSPVDDDTSKSGEGAGSDLDAAGLAGGAPWPACTWPAYL